MNRMSRFYSHRDVYCDHCEGDLRGDYVGGDHRTFVQSCEKCGEDTYYTLERDPDAARDQIRDDAMWDRQYGDRS